MFLHDVGVGDWFTWHPVFMTLGFLFFMTRVLTYYRAVAARENKIFSRSNAVLQFVCGILISFAVYGTPII